MAVYFARQGDAGPVKIGVADDVPARIRELQCGNSEPLTVLRQIEGGRLVESFLHRHYAAGRQRGEWFGFCPTMLTIEPPPAAAAASSSFGVLGPAEMELVAADAGLTMVQVCKAAGIAHSTWTRWKNGITNPRLDVYLRMRAAIAERAA